MRFGARINTLCGQIAGKLQMLSLLAVCGAFASFTFPTRDIDFSWSFFFLALAASLHIPGIVVGKEYVCGGIPPHQETAIIGRVNFSLELDLPPSGSVTKAVSPNPNE